MNRRRVAATGLAAAAIVGTGGPAWAFWTLTSDPGSTAGAKADSLVAAHAEAGRNGKSGVNATITIRLGAGIADRFTVYRGPDLVCLNKPANQVCAETGSNNSGDKTYTITQYVGTNWVSSVTTCVFKNNDAVADPSSINCSPLTSGSAAPLAARTVAPTDNSPAPKPSSTVEPAPAPALAPTPTSLPEPSPAPASTAPAPSAEEPPPVVQEPAETPVEGAAPEETAGAPITAPVEESPEPPSPSGAEPTTEPNAD